MGQRIRIGETDRVPLEPNCGYWFLIVTAVDGHIEHRDIMLSKSGAKEVLGILHRYKDRPDECSVFHVWHGRNRTDLFLMDIPLLIKRLESEVVQ